MVLRRLLILIACLAVAWAAVPASGAFAQSGNPRALQPDQAEGPKRPARRPAPTRAERLDALYEALKAAPNAQTAQVLESRIEAALLQSGSDTADLLMTRARNVMSAKDYDLSLELLDSIIEIAPKYTEAYAQRATVHYLKKNIHASLADLRVVIAREPRHFAALVGLGVILQDIGERKRALDAFRRAVAVHPHIKAIPEMIKRLEVQVEGREI